MKAPHENTKFPIMIKEKTLEEKKKDLLNQIEHSFEEDVEERGEFLWLFSRMTQLLKLGDQEKELARIQSLLIN